MQQPPSTSTFEARQSPFMKRPRFAAAPSSWSSTFLSVCQWLQTCETAVLEWALTAAMFPVLWGVYKWSFIPAVFGSRILSWILLQRTMWSSPWACLQMFGQLAILSVSKSLEVILPMFWVFLTFCGSACVGLKWFYRALPRNEQQRPRSDFQQTWWQQTAKMQETEVSQQWERRETPWSTPAPQMCPWASCKWIQGLLQPAASALKKYFNIVVIGMHLAWKNRPDTKTLAVLVVLLLLLTFTYILVQSVKVYICLASSSPSMMSEDGDFVHC